MTTDAIDVTLSPAALGWAAADLIEAQGLAHDDYFDATSGLPPRECPLDLPGALAVAGGFKPDTWEDDRDAGAGWRIVLDTADWLVDAFALDHDEAYGDALGNWSDERDAATVVRELRQAALEVLGS